MGTPPKKDSPLEHQKAEEISYEPAALPPGFEWCAVDIVNEEELGLLHAFLRDNYVEDREGLMRMEYPLKFLKWHFAGPN